MIKIFLMVAVCVLTAKSAYGQMQSSTCVLKIAKAPAVRGVRLGTKIEEVLALFPGSAAQDGISSALSKAEGYPNFGVVGINIFPSQYSSKERFAGIANYNLIVMDGRLAQYEVQYYPPPLGPTWTRVDDFITKIAEAFQLPPASNWVSQPNISNWKTLSCDGFQLRASNLNFQGTLTLSSIDSPWKIQQERRAAFEENIRREFKP